MENVVCHSYLDKDGVGAVTVCYLKDNKQVARGISVWNKKDDKYDENTGIFHAKCNAERALKGRKINEITNPLAIKTLIECQCPFVKKAEILTRNTLPFWVARRLFGNKQYKEFYKKQSVYKRLANKINTCKCTGSMPNSVVKQYQEC